MSSLGYTFEQMRSDFTKALGNSRVGPYSGRYIGDPSKLTLWTKAKFEELYNGLVSAYVLFYSDIGVSFKNFAQVVMCECLQESTGNYNLWVGPIMFNDGDAHGLIQATPQSVILDYHVWGQPMVDVSGQVVLRPDEVLKWDLSHCTLNLLIWAWYTRNTLGAGMSLNEFGFPEWGRRPNNIVKDFGNALYVWLGGPENYRQDKTKIQNNPGHLDYYNRVKDYYTCNMGDEATFERVFNAPVPSRQIALNAPQMNISPEALNAIRAIQQQSSLNISRTLTLKDIMNRRCVLYGLDKIHCTQTVKMTSKKHNSWPYNMTDDQVEKYKRDIYPIWNRARLEYGAREVRGDKLEWVVNGKVYRV